MFNRIILGIVLRMTAKGHRQGDQQGQLQSSKGEMMVSWIRVIFDEGQGSED